MMIDEDSGDEEDDQMGDLLTNNLTMGKGVFPYTRDCRRCGGRGTYLRKDACTNRNCILARRCKSFSCACVFYCVKEGAQTEIASLPLKNPLLLGEA